MGYTFVSRPPPRGYWAAFLRDALLSGAATPQIGVWVMLSPIVIPSTPAASALTGKVVA